MKITQAHREELAKLLAEQWTADQLRNRWRQYREAGLSNTRFLFDLFYMIPTGPRQRWIDEVYKYADDTHLETALGWAVRKVEAGK
jgi:hypothetical protein